MKNESQPVALVTGASSGIGKATAILLATNGFRVFGTSRTPDGNLSLPYSLLSMDVRSDASVHAAVQYIQEQAGRIDVLINNAGYTQAGAIEENSLADAQAQFDTNLFGVLRVTNAVLPTMRHQRSGRIINVSSLVGQVAPPYIGLYASSKFALEGLSEALRGELRPFHIYVSLVEPGFVKTNLTDEAPAHPLADYEQRRQVGMAFVRQGVDQGLDPSLVARTILHIATVSQPRLRYPIGRVATLLITLKRLLPEPAFERMRRRAFRSEDPSLLLSQMPSR
jgi:NAD(P)-dependent dehydrogenase (short-subunit alcohol dehydrogenase family)